MMWQVETTDVFDDWYDSLNDTDRESVLAALILLREKGPLLPRPHADTVKDSCHTNMKELRVQSKGDPIRAFFAFDPLRRGILLCAGNKTGNAKRFYKQMIPIADKLFTEHLEKLKER
ncbi:type II toxin-antitoxin system RelE/ParE family toxin [Saccharophagus sp. K07]|uniref:type II toxin-antitoxin system RelE/ParE family toxin n=1 Tax=Saccharophagus sp. K07 TaxID=2283636 RepID=UPI00351CA0BC